MNLLCVILVINCLSESFDERVDDQVSDLNRKIGFALNRFHDLLEELTSRGVYSLELLVEAATKGFDSLANDRLQGDVDDCLNVLAWAILKLMVGLYVSKLLLQGLSNILRDIVADDVLDELTLSVKNDIPKLIEIYNHYFWLVAF